MSFDHSIIQSGDIISRLSFQETERHNRRLDIDRAARLDDLVNGADRQFFNANPLRRRVAQDLLLIGGENDRITHKLNDMGRVFGFSV